MVQHKLRCIRTVLQNKLILYAIQAGSQLSGSSSNYVEAGDHFGFCNFQSAVRFLSEDLEVMHSSIRHFLWSRTMLFSLFQSAYKQRVSFLQFRFNLHLKTKYTKIVNILMFFSLSGAYSCLRVKLTFARQLSFFIVTIYIPCFMIVIVSWMSFWIDYKAVSLMYQYLCTIHMC